MTSVFYQHFWQCCAAVVLEALLGPLALNGSRSKRSKTYTAIPESYHDKDESRYKDDFRNKDDPRYNDDHDRNSRIAQPRRPASEAFLGYPRGEWTVTQV